MGKITLSPADVLAVLKSKPEFAIELAEHTRRNVEELVARKLTKEMIDHRVDRAVEKAAQNWMLQDPISRRLVVPAGWFREMMVQWAAGLFKQHWAGVNTARVEELMMTVAPGIQAAVKSELRGEIRELIRAEIRSMLAIPPEERSR